MIGAMQPAIGWLGGRHAHMTHQNPLISVCAPMAKIYDAEMQYLNVAFAKNIGLNGQGAVESFESDRCTREAAGLRPLLIYSITAPCYSVRARLLVDAAAPIAISQFLARAWSPAHGVGMPLHLEMEEALIQSDKGFVAWCQSQGVTCDGAGSVKSLRALARSAQDLASTITFTAHDRRCKVASSLEAANASLHYYDKRAISSAWGKNTSMVQMTFEAWIGRGQPFFDGTGTIDDWNADGVREKERRVSMRPLVSRDPDDDECDVDCIKEIVEMWPGGRRVFLREASVTARDFDYWASGKGHLFDEELHEVLRKSGAKRRGVFHRYRLCGGNLLVARTAKGTRAVCDEIAGGDDVEFAFEILAPEGKNLAMRVLVFGLEGGDTTLILFPRDGGDLEAILDQRSIINVAEPRPASEGVWEDLSTIVQNFDDYDIPEAVGWGFGVDHRSWLTS